jgi:WD40 repeat protein
MPASTRRGQRDDLRRVARALGRETHILSETPADLWQQLYNRLQWQAPEGGALAGALAAQLAAHRRPAARPWLHNRTPQGESEALIATLPNDERIVAACAFSPDGRLAFGAGDYVLTVHDLETGAATSLATRQSVPHQLVCSPDGRRVVLLCHSALLSYDIAAQSLDTVLSYRYPDDRVSLQAAVFTADRLLVASEWGHTATLLDGATGAPVGTLEGDSSFEPCLFSRRGDRLLTMNVLRLWDVPGERRLGTYPSPDSRALRCALSPDDTRLASGDSDGRITVRSIPDGAILASWQAHPQAINACAYTPDGSNLVTASQDRTLAVWDAAGARIATLSGHAGPVTTCAVSADGRRVLSGSWDATLKVWDLAEADAATGVAGHTQRVTSCRFAPDGTLALSAGDDGTLQTWDVAGGRARATLAGHSDAVTSCDVSADGGTAVSASLDKSLRVWDVAGGECVAVLQGHEGGVTGCAVTPDGATAVSCSRDATLRVWDARGGACLHVLRGHEGGVNACAVSPDGRLAVSVGNDTTVRLWHLRAGICRYTLPGNMRPVHCCAFSPDGRYVAAAGWDNRLRLWETAGGRPYAVLEGHAWANDRDGIRYCHFSPDGAFVVTGAFDGTLRLWDVAGAQQVLVFEEPGRARRHPTCAAFAGDGRYVAAGFGRSLHVLDTAGGRRLLTYRSPDTLTAVAFSPAARVIAAGVAGGGVAILEAVALPAGSGAL